MFFPDNFSVVLQHASNSEGISSMALQKAIASGDSVHSEEFQKPQPLLVSEKTPQYTSNLYGSAPPICIAVPSWFLSPKERDTQQYGSHLYSNAPPMCAAILLRKYWGLGSIHGALIFSREVCPWHSKEVLAILSSSPTDLAELEALEREKTPKGWLSHDSWQATKTVTASTSEVVGGDGQFPTWKLMN